MSVTRLRLLLLAAAAGFVGTALLIRAVSAGAVLSSGRLEQYSGTALYASTVYVGVLLLWPRLSPWATGATALAWCWAVECLQLTGVPAGLSERSPLARLVLGMKFDTVDLLWYPAGIVPLALLHRWATRVPPSAGRAPGSTSRRPGGWPPRSGGCARPR